jgi:cysteine-rich repeat protein
MKRLVLLVVSSTLAFGCRSEFPLSLIPDGSIEDAQVLPDSAPPPDGTVLPDATLPDGAPPDGAPPTDAQADTGTPGCGDGEIVGAEQCDDGNQEDGDGCSSSCQVETGWQCTGEPSVCETDCGDGIVAGTELCDDGNQEDGDGCNSSCEIECSNGSTSDCNLAGQTLNSAAAFVDLDPPAGFVQCAGFRNTAQNDVGPHWDAHCLNVAAALRIRYYDTSSDPWVLLGDATLTPAADGTYTTQSFGATNNGGTQGVMETGGVTFLMDDPGGVTISSFECEEGPAGRHFQATDFYFANQANDRVIVASGNSSTDDGAAIQTDDEELSMVQRAFEQCPNASLNQVNDLAVSIFVEN